MEPKAIDNQPRRHSRTKLVIAAAVLFSALVLPAAAGSLQAIAASGVGIATTQSGSSSPNNANAASSPDTSPPNKAARPPGSSTNEINSATLQQQIAKLPPLTNTGIDPAASGKAILAHLDSVMRFYRASVQAIQKVGQPSDVLYQEQSATEATQIAQLAFKAARNEATLLSKVQGAPAQMAPAGSPEPGNQPPQNEAQRLAALRARIAQQTADLQARDEALDKQIATAKAKNLPALRQQKEQVEGGLELQKAITTALNRLGTVNEPSTQKGLVGDIDRLQRSAPELLSTSNTPKAPPVLENFTSARDAGVTSEAVMLFQLLSTRRAIEDQIAAVDQLRAQVDGLRAPMVKILRSTVQQGQALSQQTVDLAATPTTDAQDLADTRSKFETLTATFQVLANATLPLSQEIVLLEQDRGTLSTWRAAVNDEYQTVLRALLLRVVAIAIALFVLFLLSQIWSRATVRYVHDLRRRRQLLVIRRVVVGFLSGLVIIFGFVTEFSSLATFAGFISAGIAVGLQTILLSVAAYFFIVGRYGVKVGDRITVANVTGDVIEVGLARFYMMELAGTGTELHSTGRVAVFANSVLFQTGTPLYKQMPGTEYAWHELTVKLNPGADVSSVSNTVLRVVNDVFATYSARIVQQQQQVEAWMGTALEPPKVESRLQLAEGGLQIVVLYPVEIRNAAPTDQQIARNLMSTINSNEAMKSAIAGTPVIKASIKS